MKSRRGGALMEAVMFLPVILGLLVGTVELGRVVYTYYTLQKMMYGLGRYLGTQQGVNLCDSMDPAVVAAENYVLTGDASSADNPIIPGLTPSMFVINILRYDPVARQTNPCDCSAAGCDASQGGLPPDFVTVSLVSGYSVHPVFWGFAVDAFALNPTVMVPYGGT